MKLKLDDAGHAVLQDGKPVYVHDDGREAAIDVPKTIADFKVRTDALDAELKPLRELKTRFAGIEDADAARSALQVVANLKDGKLIEAGKVDEVLTERLKQHTEKSATDLKAKDATIATLSADLFQATVGRDFASSKLLAEKTFLPPAAAQAMWGEKFFKVENGVTVGYDHDGKKIFSASDPNKPAEFDEALGVLIKADKFADRYLKGNNNGGGGSHSSPANLGAGDVDLSKLPAEERLAYGLAHPAAKGA